MDFSSFVKEEDGSKQPNVTLVKRFSSVEPKSPNSPLRTPSGLDNAYSLPEDDAVFKEEQQPPQRISSVESKSSISPLRSRSFHDNTYSLPDDDAVFTEPSPKENNNLGHMATPPPTPGTAPAASGHASNQRKPRLRHLACILVAVVVLTGLVASVALILVFVNKESSSPRSLPISASPRTVQGKNKIALDINP
ncbi:hypothetical protein EGW08_002826 [Elysia chlorotica]|uniref:Uncharacterized protein n=1 Tax=Elysia chlorotica TaxID=188477 RepID=A0A3S1BR25_ELYCH|nr:hypothetical protein EGW08_002826 [Elysia chlorotica]